MKLFLKIFLGLFLFWGTARFCHRQTEGFQLAKISSPLPISQEWQLPAASQQQIDSLKALFSQPFSYLDSGGQCYAFLSGDKKIVLKLFKLHHLYQYPFSLSNFSLGIFDRWRIQFLLLQKQKLDKVFSSSKIAYTELKNETGLLFVNLNPSKQFEDLQLTLIDNIGIAHHLDMSAVPFVLQERADNPFTALRSHLLHQKRRSIPAKRSSRRSWNA